VLSCWAAKRERGGGPPIEWAAYLGANAERPAFQRWSIQRDLDNSMAVG
jgi:hypothetical protein